MRSKKFLILAVFLLLSFCVSSSVCAEEVKTVSVSLKKNPKLVKKTLRLGTDAKLNVKYKKKPIPGAAVVFTSSNPAVAAVNKDGTIVLRKKGYTIITAAYRKRRARIRLKVKASKAVAASSYALPDDVIAIEKWLETNDLSAPPSYAAPLVSGLRNQIVDYAKGFVGILPYVWGGNSLKTGTDCSGFVHLIFDKFGISVPRTARDFQGMANIEKSQLQPGDLVCYKYGGHVALYIGNEKVVHAKGAAYGTCIDSMWYGNPTGYVRIIRE